MVTAIFTDSQFHSALTPVHTDGNGEAAQGSSAVVEERSCVHENIFRVKP